MEEVEKMNIVIENPQQQQIGFVPRYNLYMMEVD